MVIWVLYVALGLLVGFGFGLYFGRLEDSSKIRQREDMQHDLQSSISSFENYKRQAKDHFLETSKLINNLTESYYAVHKHLADGAKTVFNEPSQLEGFKTPSVKQIQEISTELENVEQDSSETKPQAKSVIVDGPVGANQENVQQNSTEQDKNAESSSQKPPIKDQEAKAKKSNPTVH